MRRGSAPLPQNPQRKKRIQPVPVNNNNRAASKLYHDTKAIQRQKVDFNALENQWHVRRAHTLKNQQPLEELGQKQYIESSDTNFPTEEGEASQLPDLDFEEGYAHKAKGIQGNGVAMVLSVETSHRQW